MRKGFIFYKSFYDSIKELDPKDQVQIYNAIFEYQFNNNLIKLEGICRSIFALIIPQLEANNNRYENGCKGGAPLGNKNALKNNQKTTEKQPKNNQKTTEKQPKEKEKEKDKDNIINNIIKKEINKEKKYYENNELNDLFLEFLELRKKIKCKNTDRAVNLLINKLSGYSDDIKIEMLNNAIMNSWKSVYPIKNKNMTPSWFNKEVQQDIATEEDEKEIKELLKDFK